MERSIIDRDRLTRLRLLFVGLVAVAIAVSLAAGQSPLPAAVGGFVLGGISFVAVVLFVLVSLGARSVLGEGS